MDLAATARRGRAHERPLLMGFRAMVIKNVSGPTCIEAHERPLLVVFRVITINLQHRGNHEVPRLPRFLHSLIKLHENGIR